MSNCKMLHEYYTLKVIVICSLMFLSVRSFCGHKLPFQGEKMHTESKNQWTPATLQFYLGQSSCGGYWFNWLKRTPSDYRTTSLRRIFYFVSSRNNNAVLNVTIQTGKNRIIIYLKIIHGRKNILREIVMFHQNTRKCNPSEDWMEKRKLEKPRNFSLLP